MSPQICTCTYESDIAYLFVILMVNIRENFDDYCWTTQHKNILFFVIVFRNFAFARQQLSVCKLLRLVTTYLRLCERLYHLRPCMISYERWAESTMKWRNSSMLYSVFCILNTSVKHWTLSRFCPHWIHAMLTIAVDDPGVSQSVSLSVFLSRGRDLQKQLNGSTCSLRWRLLESRETLYYMANCE